jgi:signal transduction histidine kinase
LLFQAVRELVQNVIKHAHARRIEVTVREQHGEVHVRVEDDGVGAEPARLANGHIDTGGYGLFSIRERLDRLGGRLEIRSQPSKGTRVTLVVPSQEQAQPRLAPLAC